MTLEPPELGMLAEHLRDETWLDMRVVDIGTVQRVRLNAISVHRTRDLLVVEQRWTDGDDVRTDEFAVDAEDVRWCRESQVALEDVAPCQRPILTVVPWKRVVDEIIRTIAFLTEGVSEADLRSGGKQTGCIRPRQEAMWLVYEMTDLSPPAICTEHFGYASQQPMVTVHNKIECAVRNGEAVHWNEAPSAWLERVRVAQKLIDSNLGVRARRSTDSPWRKVL